MQIISDRISLWERVFYCFDRISEDSYTSIDAAVFFEITELELLSHILCGKYTGLSKY